MRKKSIFGLLFYVVCFFLLTGTIYRLGLLIPPSEYSPMYRYYINGLICISVLISLLAMVPWFVMELRE